MTLEDWRDADPAVVADLYARERQRWLDELGWDTEASWAIVETGRTLGHVPGWILRDADGRVLGWTFYILHEGELQIGGLTADRAVDLRRLLDGVLGSPEASLATAMSGFIFPALPSLVSALKRRRFAVRQSLFLSRSLDDADPARFVQADVSHTCRVRPFMDRDMLCAVRLLASAYEGEPGAQCFAPRGRLEEWVHYVRQLVETPACGRFQPSASLVAEDPTSGRLVGLVLSTALSPETAHIAQLVVGQQARRQGVGETLLLRACGEARDAGSARMTLMVDEGNTRALSLYPDEAMQQQLDSPRVPVAEAVVLAPLAKDKIEPEVILIFGNPAQIMMLLCGLQKEKYERFDFHFIGEGACSDSLGECYRTGKPQLSIPCYGERSMGQVADDEISLALPPADAGRALSGLKKLARIGFKYPISFIGAQADLEPILSQIYPAAFGKRP